MVESLKSRDISLPHNQLHDLFERADRNQDGGISFTEFLAFMQSDHEPLGGFGDWMDYELGRSPHSSLSDASKQWMAKKEVCQLCAIFCVFDFRRKLHLKRV